MKRVEHLIIGAGMAGLVLRHLLDSEDVVLLDPNPGGYKIGESLVPELFQHPELAALLPRLQELPSWTAKYGTAFIADGAVAYFPVGGPEVGQAMHIDRSEMERAMIEAWDLSVVDAKVTGIDFDRSEVSTTAGDYKVSGLILDCSGPAMVVASFRDEVEDKLPLHATWAYYDVVAEDSSAFRRVAAERGWNILEYDVRQRRPIPSEVPAEHIARFTYLTQIHDGVWTWQIPLFGGTRLSYGVVSRHGAVSDEDFRAIAEAHHAPQFEIARRPEDGAFPYDRLHRRSSVAREARTPAGENFILLADAYAFSDPIYSVGAALAVSHAIEVSGLLNAGAWNREACATFTDRSRAAQARAREAFEFWYTGEVITDADAATDVQNNFLRGDLFQVELTKHYGTALELASRLEEADPFAVDWEASDLAEPIAELLSLAPPELEGWTLLGARPCAGGTQLRWSGHGPELLMLVSDDTSGEERCFRRSGDFALSYMQPFEGDYPVTAPLTALFDAFAAQLEVHGDAWRELTAGT